MAYAKKIKEQVTALRKKGNSINAITRKTGVAKSTVSLWIRDVQLPIHLRLSLEDAQLKGREKGQAANKIRRVHEDNLRKSSAELSIKKLLKSQSSDFWKLVTALLYWCEGEKTSFSTLRFSNSDPELIKSFLTALRKGFEIDERKFRILMHLHSYHNERQSKQFWSKQTGIPIEQFTKTYHKPHTGAQTHPGYKGCISLRYNDAKVAKTIAAIYHAFANETVGE
jgi:hypothetical protein